jgi:PadR family transcriptional regulator PadR
MLYICTMDNEFVNKWQSQVKKGTLSFIILNVLKDNEYYGYELIEKIKQTTQIEIAEGTLYPLLNRLKKDELVASKWVEQESGIPRKYYTITTEGENTLKEMQKYWIDINSSIQKLILK